MKAKNFVFLSALLAAVLVWDPVDSYSLLGYQWPKKIFRYYINPANRDISDDKVIRSIKKGASPWRPWVRAGYLGTTTNRKAKNDGMNTIFFRQAQYGALASTYIFRKGNEIVDVDIVFWDDPWKFYAGSKGCNGEDGFYITDVATHEFGHAIGLGHSRKKVATMFKRSFFCNTSARSLETDDWNAASSLYGTPQTTAMILNPGE